MKIEKEKEKKKRTESSFPWTWWSKASAESKPKPISENLDKSFVSPLSSFNFFLDVRASEAEAEDEELLSFFPTPPQMGPA